MNGAILTHSDVAVDGNLITGRGLGAAIPFALKLVETLTDPETANRIAKAICYEFSRVSGLKLDDWVVEN